VELEIVVNVQADRVCMILHWQGGDHSVLQFLKRKTGQRRYGASEHLISLVRELAREMTADADSTIWVVGTASSTSSGAGIQDWVAQPDCCAISGPDRFPA